jgi:hypothetical protein
MVRLDTMVVTSLKPYRQCHSFQFRTYFFATLGLLAALPALAFANETPARASARFIPTASQIRSLTIEQAKQGRAVHLTGVITHFDPGKLDLESMPFDLRESIGETMGTLGFRAQFSCLTCE